MNLQNLIRAGDIYGINVLSGVSVPLPLSTEATKSAIMMRCGLLEPCYNEPEIFRAMLASWFNMRQWNFKHLIKIIQAEYSPIENTDRYSEHKIANDGTETVRRTGQKDTTGTDNSTDGGTDRTVTDRDRETGNNNSVTYSGSESETRTDTISAENSNTYQPDAQHKTTGTDEHTETGTGSETEAEDVTQETTYGKTNTRTENRSETESCTDSKSSIGTQTYTEHTHGNIGITTNTQLINEELDLMERFNVYEWIAERVEQDFFIMVY